jgi:hypothetical protein
MSSPLRLALFAGALVLVFAASAVAGGAIGPEPTTEPAAPAHAEGEAAHAGDELPGEHAATGGASHGATAQSLRGLASAADGLRLVVEDPELRRGRAERLAFRIVDDHGDTVRHFDVGHTKRMHLIVARRDLTGFQHLHPEQRADGAWETRATLGEAGSYRLFADFSRGGEPQTLASDLRVDGRADLRSLPAPASAVVSDGGYDVELASSGAGPGEEAELRFTISRDGRPVATEPYLGAGGHLVALREGDLAFLHVHPTEEAGDNEIGFAATFPTEGRYRLFLQFQHDGEIQTVAFTQEVR